MNRYLCMLVLGCSFVMIGCGGSSDAPQLVYVEGVVSWKGKPLENADVVFTPESGPVAIGQTDSNGHFQLSTQGRPGAAIGAHKVSIQAYDEVAASKDSKSDPENPAKLVPKIPVKYGNYDSSGLEATVADSGSSNKFEFKLE